MPASFKIFVIVFPVIGLVNGTLCRSRRIVPISRGGCPSFPSLIMMASTSSGLYLHQEGGLLLTGRIEWDFPFSCFGNFSTVWLLKSDTVRIFKTFVRVLEFHISLKMKEGKTREQAIEELIRESKTME